MGAKRWVIGGAVFAAAALAIEQFGLAKQSVVPVSSIVFDARVMLGRWPKTWEEAVSALSRLPNYPPITKGKFSEIEVIPLANDRCLVIGRGPNAIGFPSEDRRVFEWTEESERHRNDYLKEWGHNPDRDRGWPDGGPQ